MPELECQQFRLMTIRIIIKCKAEKDDSDDGNIFPPKNFGASHFSVSISIDKTGLLCSSEDDTFTYDGKEMGSGESERCDLCKIDFRLVCASVVLIRTNPIA